MRFIYGKFKTFNTLTEFLPCAELRQPVSYDYCSPYKPGSVLKYTLPLFFTLSCNLFGATAYQTRIKKVSIPYLYGVDTETIRSWYAFGTKETRLIFNSVLGGFASKNRYVLAWPQKPFGLCKA